MPMLGGLIILHVKNRITACVERLEVLPNGTIPQVEMTSLAFKHTLSV